MSDFGITGVRWNAARTEVESCRLHGIDMLDGRTQLTDGEEAGHASVASLIGSGHRVWVLRGNADGSVVRLQELNIRGENDHLYTIPSSSLFELTEF